MTDLVKVAFAQDPTEGAMIQALLREEGIESILKGTEPDGIVLAQPLLAPSPQQVLVRPGDAEKAAAALSRVVGPGEGESELANAGHLRRAGRGWRRFGSIGGMFVAAAVSVAIMAIVFAIYLLLRAV